jgi:glutamate dehydrogenase (NADP+)
VDPKKLSLSEKERLARAYLNALMDEVGPDVDILSPDLGTDASVMSWMADQYNKNRRAYVPGAINGKPPALGGILGRPTATARGAWTVLSAFYAERGISPTGLTFAIQGYGSAGGNLARILQQNGLRLVAASDSSGGLYSPAGLDAEALWKAKEQGHPFKDLQIGGSSAVANDEVLTVKADLIIPAATANQITRGVARNLKCRWVVEIANSPIASDAEDEVVARGIEIIPDIVANAGGITMSHFEWAQNRGGLSWTAAESSSRLDSKMSVTADNLLQVARQRNVSLAIASQFMALERLSSALHL